MTGYSETRAVGFQQAAMTREDQVAKALRHQVFAAAGIAIGSASAAKVLIGNTVEFAIAGVAYSKSTAEIAFTATTHDITAVAGSVQEAIYVLTVIGDGTTTITMGDVATGAGEAVLPDYSDLPADSAIIGWVRVAVAAGSTDFDASTDLLSAGHLTDTYYSALGGVYPMWTETL